MVHLTNYSLNKKSCQFRMFKQGAVSEEECHKRTVGTTLRQLKEAGYNIDADVSLVSKTIDFLNMVNSESGKKSVPSWERR